ncbi:MAG: Type 1 glutamine amidotransferase-like domain-containing protein [Actinomycetota bacterium]
MTGRSFALLGSGEFEPWTTDVDRWLLGRTTRTGPVLIAPTASAPEGEDVFRRWAGAGLEHFGGGSRRAEVLELRTREDAFREDVVERLVDASVLYFSGGNPAYLVETLADTPFWTAVLTGLERGLSYAGCSAGVAALGVRAPDSSRRGFSDDAWRDGLGLFPRTLFGPHWDAVDFYLPGATAAIQRAVPPGARLFAIDENTAAVGDGRTWSVIGSGSVAILEAGAWRRFASGETYECDAVGEAQTTSEMTEERP